MEEEEKQVETSPTLERKRAKYTVEDVRNLCGGISRSTVMREIRRKRKETKREYQCRSVWP